MPDFLSVLTDGTVGGELGAAGNVQQALTAEGQAVCVVTVGTQLCFKVGFIIHQQEGVVLLPNHLPTQKLVSVGSPNDRMSLILHGGSGGICTKIFRRDWIFSHELFFPEHTFFEDNYWLAMACLYIDRFYVVDKVCYHYMDHP